MILPISRIGYILANFAYFIVNGREASLWSRCF